MGCRAALTSQALHPIILGYVELAKEDVMGRKVAYCDCFSGASGDMLLGALLDSGFELTILQTGLAALGIDPTMISASKYMQHGISGTRLVVHDPVDSQPARTLPAIRELLLASGLPQEISESSLRIFTRIAEVEGRIHGLPPDEVHFHELSALDSLVDIVGFNLALRELGIEAIFSSPLPLGHGSIMTAHGVLPVPAPATLALLADVQAPTIPSPAHAELVTPTGAGILTTLAEFRQPAMTIQRVGYGLGMKEFAWANFMRVWIGQELDLPSARHNEGEPHSHDGEFHTHTSDEEHSHHPDEHRHHDESGGHS